MSVLENLKQIIPWINTNIFNLVKLPLLALGVILLIWSLNDYYRHEKNLKKEK